MIYANKRGKSLHFFRKYARGLAYVKKKQYLCTQICQIGRMMPFGMGFDLA